MIKHYFLLLFFCAHFGLAQEWELKRSKNNIKVYTRGLDSTKINEYKAVLIANATPEKALNIITNGNDLWKWNHNTSESKLIKQLSENEYIFWIKNKLPWPLKNRDNVPHIKVNKFPDGSIKIDISPDKTNSCKEQEDCIRITNFKGYWLIKPLDKNTIEVTQQLYGDPGGGLPAWLLNSLITSSPFQTFKNLKEILEN